MSWEPVTGSPGSALTPITEHGDVVANVRSDFNANQLADELVIALNKPEPKSAIGRIFNGWKHKLSANRIDTLINYTNRVVELNETVASGHVRVAVLRSSLAGIIRAEKEKLVYAGEQMLAEHEAYLNTLKHEEAERALALEMKSEEIEKIKTENYINKIIGEANAEAIKAETRANTARASMLEKLKDEMDLNNISSSQAFVLAKALNPNANTDIDFSMKEKMFEEELYKARQQNRMTKAEADLTENNVKATIGEDENSQGGFGND